MSDEEIVNQLSSATTMVHVKNPDAYDAFARGMVIFDISSEGRLLEAFAQELQPEFDRSTISREPYTWPAFPTIAIHTVYHKHNAIEAAMPELGEIEDEEL